MGAICPPIRRALIGAGGFLLLRDPLPEENIQKEDHLRPPRLRRRTVTENQPSSGQHSFPGVELFGVIYPPIRRGLIGAGSFLLLRGPLPEENIQNEDHLRPLRLRRRTVTESQPNSGEHSLIGVGDLPRTTDSCPQPTQKPPEFGGLLSFDIHSFIPTAPFRSALARSQQLYAYTAPVRNRSG